MPFSELLMFSKAKFDSTQPRTPNLPADLSFQSHSDCCELVWNQCNKEKKASSSIKPQDAKNSKLLNDFPLTAPPCDITFDEDAVPWASCPNMEPFSNVYTSDILAESFGATVNGDGQALTGPTGVKPQKSSNPTNFAYFSRFGSVSKKSGSHMDSVFLNSSVGFSQQDSVLAPDLILPEKLIGRWRDPDGKAAEPAGVTSSVCSANSLERDSNNFPSGLKRKGCETGDSEGPSDEAEEESVGVRKTCNRSGSKRSRAAEVHNQSERRRRERINEKMRLLQELIPNCNKVDKASMLDEAIEYLKTLQLQVQVLSMGTGMYMSQMMLPAALQHHMYRPPMSQFSPMGLGLATPFGFGLNLPDMSTLMHMPSPFPVSGSSGFNGMPLVYNSPNQGPNQETIAVNEAENATGFSNAKLCQQTTAL